MGTSHSDSCNSLAKEIWEWCIARDIWVSVAHIPGSRTPKCSIKVKIFSLTLTYLRMYVSYRPDPEAFAIDAFFLQWSKLDFYAFPPFSVIPALLSEMQREEALGVVVLPDWPAQGWYPKLWRC